MGCGMGAMHIRASLGETVRGRDYKVLSRSFYKQRKACDVVVRPRVFCRCGVRKVHYIVKNI